MARSSAPWSIALDLLDRNAGLRSRVDADGAAIGDHRRAAGEQPAVDAADGNEELRPDEVLHRLRDLREVFELRQLVDDRQHLLDGVDRLILVAGMRGATDGRNVEIVSAPVGDVDLHVGELGEHAVVELVASKQVDAPGLLTHVVGDRGKRDLALEVDAAVDQRPDAADQRAEAGLHVHDAVAEQSAVLDGAVERIAVPAFAHRLGIEMPGEQEVGAGLAAVDLPQGIETAFIGLFAPDLADAEGLEPRLQLARERVFLAVRAVDPHDLLGDADRRFDGHGSLHLLQHLGVHHLFLYANGARGGRKAIPARHFQRVPGAGWN